MACVAWGSDALWEYACRHVQRDPEHQSELGIGWSSDQLELIWDSTGNVDRIWGPLQLDDLGHSAWQIRLQTRRTFYRLYDAFNHLSDGYVDINDLWDPHNHSPDYPHSVVGMVDTMPFEVLDWRGRDLWAPHYGCPVVKLQILTTFQGRIAYFTGAHPGRQSDTRIAQMHLIPYLNLPWWARILGDGAYWGAGNHFLAPAPNPPAGSDVLQDNATIAFY
eukprot:gene16803-9601_t